MSTHRNFGCIKVKYLWFSAWEGASFPSASPNKKQSKKHRSTFCQNKPSLEAEKVWQEWHPTTSIFSLLYLPSHWTQLGSAEYEKGLSKLLLFKARQEALPYFNLLIASFFLLRSSDSLDESQKLTMPSRVFSQINSKFRVLKPNHLYEDFFNEALSLTSAWTFLGSFIYMNHLQDQVFWNSHLTSEGLVSAKCILTFAKSTLFTNQTLPSL